MKVIVVNNSKFPVYLDVKGEGQPQDIHVLGVKARETLEIQDDQFSALQAKHSPAVVIQRA